MKYDYYYPTPLNEVDGNNDNIDVCLRLGDGREYTLVVTTPCGVQSIMNKSGLPFVEPCSPFLFVEKLDDENIRQLIQSLVTENECWLRVYGADLI